MSNLSGRRAALQSETPASPEAGSVERYSVSRLGVRTGVGNSSSCDAAPPLAGALITVTESVALLMTAVSGSTGGST